jgi:hypothetical protein
MIECGAAIWQLVPTSAIFWLPAFQDTDVRNWMKTGFPAQLSDLQAVAGDPLQIERIQNVVNVLARVLTGNATHEIRELRALLNPRTAVFTPARGLSASVYNRNGMDFICI